MNQQISFKCSVCKTYHDIGSTIACINALIRKNLARQHQLPDGTWAS